MVSPPGRGGGGGMLSSLGKGGAGGGVTVPGARGTVALLGGVTAVTAAEREAISFLASSSSLDSLAT